MQMSHRYQIMRKIKTLLVTSFVILILYEIVIHLFQYFQTSICGEHRGLKQKVISFSFFGHSKALENGLIENAKMIPQLYGSDWIMRIYANESIDFLNQFSHVDICPISQIKLNGISAKVLVPRTWRFIPMLDSKVEEFHSRDLDSLPTEREVLAVKEFSLNDNFQFHIMRDHRQHVAPITAGMWGAKPNKNPQFSQFFMNRLMESSQNPTILHQHRKYTDQIILARYLYPYLNGIVLIHDAYNCISMRMNSTKAFPSKRSENDPYNYVGAIRDGSTMNKPMLEICPPPCRPKQHQDWIYC